MTLLEQITEAKTFFNTDGQGWWRLAGGQSAHVERWIKSQGRIYLQGQLLVLDKLGAIKLKKIFWDLKGKEFRGKSAYDLQHAYRGTEKVQVLEVPK